MIEKNQMPKKSQTLLNRRKLSNELSGRQLLPALLGEEVDGEADAVVVEEGDEAEGLADLL